MYMTWVVKSLIHSATFFQFGVSEKPTFPITKWQTHNFQLLSHWLYPCSLNDFLLIKTFWGQNGQSTSASIKKIPNQIAYISFVISHFIWKITLRNSKQRFLPKNFNVPRNSKEWSCWSYNFTQHLVSFCYWRYLEVFFHEQ